MAQARLVEEMWSLPNFGGFYSDVFELHLVFNKIKILFAYN